MGTITFKEIGPYKVREIKTKETFCVYWNGQSLKKLFPYSNRKGDPFISDVEVISFMGNPSCLIDAVSEGEHYDLFALLNLGGFDVNHTLHGMTALMYECVKQKPDSLSIKKLMMEGANPWLKNNGGATAVDMIGNRDDISKYFMTGVEKEDWTPPNVEETKKQDLKKLSEIFNEGKLTIMRDHVEGVLVDCINFEWYHCVYALMNLYNVEKNGKDLGKTTFEIACNNHRSTPSYLKFLLRKGCKIFNKPTFGSFHPQGLADELEKYNDFLRQKEKDAVDYYVPRDKVPEVFDCEKPHAPKLEKVYSFGVCKCRPVKDFPKLDLKKDREYTMRKFDSSVLCKENGLLYKASMYIWKDMAYLDSKEWIVCSKKEEMKIFFSNRTNLKNNLGKIPQLINLAIITEDFDVLDFFYKIGFPFKDTNYLQMAIDAGSCFALEKFISYGCRDEVTLRPGFRPSFFIKEILIKNGIKFEEYLYVTYWGYSWIYNPRLLFFSRFHGLKPFGRYKFTYGNYADQFEKGEEYIGDYLIRLFFDESKIPVHIHDTLWTKISLVKVYKNPGIRLLKKYKKIPHFVYLNTILPYIEDVNAKDKKNGDTMLHIACKENIFSAIKVLLADPRVLLDVRNSKGMLPIECAQDKKIIETLQIFQ